MKRFAWMKAALALTGLALGSAAIAADHRDAPGTTADPSADINDVYTWKEGANVILIMTVTPVADMNSKFSDKVQYVFHTESTGTFGMPGTKKDVIVTFDTAQKLSLWVTTPGAATADDYVTGDASATAGLSSTSGKVKVFAGLRDDPFFFNLDGFVAAAGAVAAAAPSLTFDTNGCPALDAATAGALGALLGGDPSMNPPGPPKDFFAGLNTLGIVVSIDQSLINGGGNFLSVWASTNVGG